MILSAAMITTIMVATCGCRSYSGRELLTLPARQTHNPWGRTMMTWVAVGL